MLTQKKAETIGPGTHCDRDGLLLKVGKTGCRNWLWRGTFGVPKKRRDLGLGSVRFVSLIEAREQAYALKKASKRNEDVFAVHQKIRNPTLKTGVPTFREAVESTITLNESTWATRTISDWRSSLERYAAPLMDRPVDAISSTDVLDTVKPHWGSTVGKVLLQRLTSCFSWAVANGHIEDNPATKAAAGLPKRNGVKTTHRASVPYAGFGEVLHRILDCNDKPLAARLCLVFQALCACRPSESRLARWSEIDGDTWVIPGSRTKTKREHRVPLSSQALAILEQAKSLPSYGSDLVFPGRGGRPMSDARIGSIFRDCLRIEATAHGSRSSFRCWAGESGVDRHIAELCLGHVVGSATERAYMRSDLLEERRKVMAAWGAFLKIGSEKVT